MKKDRLRDFACDKGGKPGGRVTSDKRRIARLCLRQEGYICDKSDESQKIDCKTLDAAGETDE